MGRVTNVYDDLSRDALFSFVIFSLLVAAKCYPRKHWIPSLRLQAITAITPTQPQLGWSVQGISPQHDVIIIIFSAAPMFNSTWCRYQHT